jgi:hypothetical protein
MKDGKSAELHVRIRPSERAALDAMCEQDVRSPSDMVRFLIIEEAKRRNIWPVDATEDTSNE